jgi:aminoglycoside N3'-acetyltransferase
MYYDALCEVLGTDESSKADPMSDPQPLSSHISYPFSPIPNSSSFSLHPSSFTIAVPTFTFAFARGEPYDPQASPSQGMGALSEYVRALPQARRTPHPLQSIAVVGQHAEDLARLDTPSAFDPGSAFERMLELDFKLLLLGADIQAVSMLHYSEQRADVPYRYWKEFRGQVRMEAGWETRTYRMFARYLEADPRIELYPVQAVLQSRHQWASVNLNYGQISLCRLADFVTVVDEFLNSDPWSLVVNREEAIKNLPK